MVRQPTTAPISDEDYQQAVTAITQMIHQWCDSSGHGTQDNRDRQDSQDDDRT